MGNQYIHEIIGTKRQRKAAYYARKAKNRAAREAAKAWNQQQQHLATIERAHNSNGDPAKATLYKGEVIVRSGEKGRGMEVLRVQAPANLAEIADVCDRIFMRGFRIVDDLWVEKLTWAEGIREFKSRNPQYA